MYLGWEGWVEISHISSSFTALGSPSPAQPLRCYFSAPVQSKQAGRINALLLAASHQELMGAGLWSTSLSRPGRQLCDSESSQWDSAPVTHLPSYHCLIRSFLLSASFLLSLLPIPSHHVPWDHIPNKPLSLESLGLFLGELLRENSQAKEIF